MDAESLKCLPKNARGRASRLYLRIRSSFSNSALHDNLEKCSFCAGFCKTIFS